MNATLSVCIPVLNEAAHLPRLLRRLEAQRGIALDIVVADGGSTDGSLESLPAGVRTVRVARGRGAQMNAAARVAGGDDLLFLHADSELDDSQLLARALAALDAARQNAGHDRVAGHFRLRFARDRTGADLLYRYMEAKTALGRPGTINGDQGLLLARAYFEALGGFDDSLPFLEDQRIADRIHAGGAWVTLPGSLTTSARRFEALGGSRVYTFMALIMAMRAAGAEAFIARVPALYRKRLPDGRLDMRAVFAAVRALQRARPLGERLRLHYRVGRYARRNAWQLPFFCDVALGLERRPLLACYDRALAPLLRNPPIDALSGALAYAWVFVILRGWFAWRDRKR